MKKQIKRIGLALVVIFALVGAGGTALAAAGYITWGGTRDYNEALQNLNEIGSRGQQLKAERDTEKASNNQLENTIKDKDNIIKDKDNIIKDKDNLIDAKVQEIETKQKEIDALRNQNTAESGQLQQAEKDMKDVNQKTKDVLNSLN